MKEILLGVGRHVALVDDADFEMLNQWHWSALNGRYAGRIVHKGHAYSHSILMHRLIMGFPGELVDHIDRNGFHNYRSNLRVASRSGNALNAGPQSNNTSGIRGVDYDKNRQKWVARIKIDGRQKFLGRFGTIEEAVAARLNAENSLGVLTPNTIESYV